MPKHGGSRKGSGRKKGSGVSSIIKGHVDAFMYNLIQDEKINNAIKKDLATLSVDEGWIYVIKDLSCNLIKIGVTQAKNPNTRISLYRTHNMDVSILYIDLISDCHLVEEMIHDLYIAKRVKGDWFDLSDGEVVDCITSIVEQKHKHIKFGRRA